MENIGLLDWIRSVPAAVRSLVGGQVRLVHARLGRRLCMTDGRTYVAFRETVRDGPMSPGVRPAVLHPRFHLRFTGPHQRLLHAVFRRVCIITTPFFVGLPGFRSKLWMVDPATGDYAGLYDWDGADEAQAYAEGLSRVLRLLSTPGSVTYELVPDTTVAEYVRLNAERRSDAGVAAR